jgi:EAL domain-containing protein (putative c-di-GMP-specific phosphodiesterase class I)
VAEGVEHAEQATALAELGCHLALGFHFSRPVPGADLTPAWPASPSPASIRHSAGLSAIRR